MAFMVEDILKSIVDELKTFATTKSIVGEPIIVEGKTIIPVIKLKLGFGGGGGEDMSVEKKNGNGTGGGGGGGVYIEPAAFITVIGDQISVLSPKGNKFEKLAESVPEIVSKIMEMKGKKTENS
jgi:uncharacterized spore protein YtfJ